VKATIEVPGGIHEGTYEAPLPLQFDQEDVFHQGLAFVPRRTRVIPHHLVELLSGWSTGEEIQNILPARFAYVFVQFINSGFVIRLLNNL
jgi:hypothetical protein